MLKSLKMKVARKFYDVPDSAYLSASEINDACILTALLYAAVAIAALAIVGKVMVVAAMLAQAFG